MRIILRAHHKEKNSGRGELGDISKNRYQQDLHNGWTEPGIELPSRSRNHGGFYFLMHQAEIQCGRDASVLTSKFNKFAALYYALFHFLAANIVFDH